MAGEVLLYTPFVAAAAMFALAGWLVGLNFRSPVNRSFAVFLILVGMTRLLNGIGFLARASDPPTWASFLYDRFDVNALRDYYTLATPFALAYFVTAYARPRGGPAWRWGGRAIVVAALAVEVAYTLDHSLHGTVGPLALLSYGTPLAYAGVAIYMAREAARDLMAPRPAAAFLVSTGLALNALVEASIQVITLAQDGLAARQAVFQDSPLANAILAGYVLAAGLSLSALGLHGVGAARRPAARRKVLLAAALYPLAALCALYFVLTRGASSGPAVTLVTLWRILLPALVAYALVRHRLFSIDVKIKWTISRGTIAFAFLALFFATSKVVENLLNQRFGLLFGGISAGILLFALSPLEKFGHRIAHAVLPNVKAPGDLADDERLHLFAEQATLVWSDGTLGRRERKLLDNLRDRLGLAFEDAARLEHAAALAAPSQKS